MLTNVCYTVVGLNEDVVFEAMTDIAGVVSFIFSLFAARFRKES